MSIGHDLTVLELESQLDVLSRIQFVSRFGSNLVHVEGVKGSGKSWLAQRYLEKWCDDANQALLMCHSNQSIQQQRGIILKQVVRDPLFNESDTVVDSIGRMLAGEKCNLVLVIDDAHLLSSELLSELWLLVQKAQSTPNWQINVLLFSESGKLTPGLARMSYGQDNKPVDIDIEPLTAEEAATFTEILVVRFAPSREDKLRIRNLVDKSNYLPAELIALGDKKAERRIIIRSVTHSPVGILGLASLLLLGAAGTYWWLNSQSSELPIIETLVDGDEPLVVTLDDKLNAELVQVNDEELQNSVLDILKAFPDNNILIDHFLDRATEAEVDAICDGEQVHIMGVMEHIEPAGIHSGDSNAVLPPFTLSDKVIKTMEEYTEKIAFALDVKGLINIQFAIKDEKVYIIEANPRASRTTPFISKAYRIPYLNIATKIMIGEQKISDFEYDKQLTGWAIKEPVFSFHKFPNVKKELGPEMKSTGEAIHFIKDLKDPVFREFEKMKSMYLRR